MSAKPSVERDPIVGCLREAIALFLNVKRRYPLLMATKVEIDAIKNYVDQKYPVNRAVVQLLRDSFDMLIIDLYSIRENLTRNEHGVFALLRQNPARLRFQPIVADDQWAAAIMNEGPRDEAHWLIGGVGPADRPAVEKLCSRFLADTHPLDQDRNRVRAHRYKYPEQDTSHLFIPLDDLQKHIDVMWRYLHALHLVLDGGGYSDDLQFPATETTARDLADLVVHRSLNDSVTFYGLEKETPTNPRRWYWLARQERLKELADTGARELESVSTVVSR